MPEVNNIWIVFQAPLDRYVIDELDINVQDDQSAVMEPARLSDRSIRFWLFCLIPLLSIVCICIFALDMITLKMSDNNGLGAKFRMKQKEGVEEITPVDYYHWIAKNKKKTDDERNLWK